MSNLFFSGLRRPGPTAGAKKPILVTTAGQSNHNGNYFQANLTELQSLRPDLIGPLGGGNVYSFRADGLPHVYNYGNVSDPTWYYAAGSNSPAMAFQCELFNILYNYWQEDIYAVVYGVDATRLAQSSGASDWNINSAELYDNWVAKIQTAIAWMEANIGVQDTDWYFAAVCWLQGESDNQSPYKEVYEQNEIDLINDLRTRFGSKILFVDSYVFNTSTAPVNIAKLANSVKDQRNLLFSNVGEVLGDGVHYTTQSQINIGAKFANKIIDNYTLFMP